MDLINKSISNTLFNHKKRINKIIKLKNIYLASCSDDFDINICNIITTDFIKTIMDNFIVYSILLLKDNILLSSNYNGLLCKWNWETSQIYHTIKIKTIIIRIYDMFGLEDFVF